MPSNEPTTPQNEFTRHAARYVIFIFLFLFAAWHSYSVFTVYQKLRADLEDITHGEDGYIVVDGERWLQFPYPKQQTTFFQPEKPIFIKSDRGTLFEKLPSDGLYELRVNGQVVQFFDCIDHIFLRAQNPNERVRVKLVYMSPQ